MAEGIGILLCIFGVYLFYRGLKGKLSFSIQSPGLKATLNNATPGGFISAIGAILIIISLNSDIGHVNTSNIILPNNHLEEWLANSYLVKGNEDYGKLIQKIFGESDSNHVVFLTRSIISNITLKEVALNEYGESKYWHLIAALNSLDNNYNFATVNENTILRPGSVVIIAQASKYNSRDSSWVKVKYQDTKEIYRELLVLADKGLRYDLDVDFRYLAESYKEKQLNFTLTLADTTGGIVTLRELSIKYYGEPGFWRLIPWVNARAFGNTFSDSTTVIGRGQVWILHIID